jgi:hypothetical protein
MESTEFEEEVEIEVTEVLIQSEELDEDDEFEDDAESELAGETVSGKPVIAMSALPITGEPRVDDALGRLSDLTNLPVHEHVAVFEDVQRRLHETLADLSGQ